MTQPADRAAPDDLLWLTREIEEADSLGNTGRAEVCRRLLNCLRSPVVQGEPKAWECACGGVMPWRYDVCGECGEMVRADTAATHLYAGAPAAETVSRADAVAVRKLAETLAACLAYACELGAGEWEAMLSGADRALLSRIPTEEMNDAER